MAECPTCGKVTDTEHGMKIHHATIHDESLSLKEYQCHWCGEIFERHQSKMKKSNKAFCSDECESRWREDSWGGEDHGLWSGGKNEYSCTSCGEIVKRYQYEVDKQDNVFCSQQCQASFYSDKNRTKVECEWCGEILNLIKYDIENNEHHFCSDQCKGRWYTENLTGEDSPHWEGGHPDYYGPTWPSQRRQTLERDEYECQDCGMTRAEHYEEWDRDLEVHHKTPIRTFNDTAEANQLSNLITLCKLCHSNREHA